MNQPSQVESIFDIQFSSGLESENITPGELGDVQLVNLLEPIESLCGSLEVGVRVNASITILDIFQLRKSFWNKTKQNMTILIISNIILSVLT